MEIYNEKYLREGDKISVEKKADCAVYRLSNAGGSGRITEYEIFEDVSVLFDDMHLESFGEGTRGAYALHIEHCKQGRFEAAFYDGRRFYLGAGDICVHNIDYGESLGKHLFTAHDPAAFGNFRHKSHLAQKRVPYPLRLSDTCLSQHLPYADGSI